MDFIDARRQAIASFYKVLLGRRADDEGLFSYVDSGMPLEEVFVSIYNSDEAVSYRENQSTCPSSSLPITLAMFVKDNADSVAMAINSVADIVSEVVIVDTGSTDNTVNICEDLGARVYKIGFSDFGNIRTITAHLARQPFVLGLDSDEVILKEDLPKFEKLIDKMEAESIDVVGLPRKRWADLAMTQQEEEWAYPDFQYRFFKNKPSVRYIRRIHEIVAPGVNMYESEDFPCIHHFQSVFKTGRRLVDRNTLYKKLHELDLAEGVEHTESPVEAIDEVE